MPIFYDLYSGLIAARLERYFWTTDWRWVRLQPGFVTIGNVEFPNCHLGLWRLEDAIDADRRKQVKPHDLANSPFALVGSILSAEERDLVGVLRFGRRACFKEEGMLLVDPYPGRAMRDLDDGSEDNKDTARSLVAGKTCRNNSPWGHA